jgi:hypothetical protein
VTIQGELNFTELPTTVNTCENGNTTVGQVRCDGLDGDISQKEVYFTLPTPSGSEGTTAFVSNCGFGGANDTAYDSIMEILWCPSTDPEATLVDAGGVCDNDDGFLALCSGTGLSQIFIEYPDASDPHYGYIPVVGIGEYDGNNPSCAIFSVWAKYPSV